MSQGFYVWSQTAASNATASSAVNWAEGQSPSSVNDSARAMMAEAAKYRDDIAGAIVTGGTSTAYTVTSYEVFDTLAHMNGQKIAFTVNATSGATVTLNVDGLGAKPLRSATGVELKAGALVSGGSYSAVYNNSDAVFYLNGFYGAFGNTTITGTLGVTGNTTLTGTLGVSSDFAVNTNMFTVTGSNGNTLVAGTFTSTGAGTFSSTLNAVGNFSVATSKFTVAAASGNTAIAGTLAVTGTSTVAAVAASSSVLSSSATAGIGYATGAGGTVTQATSKSTGVTLNAVCGTITLNNSSVASGTNSGFTFTNSAIAATDIVLLNYISGASNGLANYSWGAISSAGSAAVTVRNISAGSLAEALVFQFIVIKAVTS